MLIPLTSTSSRCFKGARSQQLVLVKSNPTLWEREGEKNNLLDIGEIEQLLQEVVPDWAQHRGKSGKQAQKSKSWSRTNANVCVRRALVFQKGAAN